MNTKYFYLILALLILLFLIGFYLNVRLNKMELIILENGNAEKIHNTILYQSFQTSINIDTVQGDGNTFGDNNTIENKIS